jgi:hypothetical protein
MKETLETLRLLHLTLVGLSAVIVSLVLAPITPFADAEKTLEALHSAVVFGLDEYFTLCDTVANKDNAEYRDRILALANAAGPAVPVASDLEIEFFGFCETPPATATLEVYEGLVHEKTYVRVAKLRDSALAAAIATVRKTVSSSMNGATLVSIKCRRKKQPPQFATTAIWRQYESSTRSPEGLTVSKLGEFVEVLAGVRRGHQTVDLRVDCDRDCFSLDTSPAFVARLWLGARARNLIDPTYGGATRQLGDDHGDSLAQRHAVFQALRPHWSAVRELSLDAAYRYIATEKDKAEREVVLAGLRMRVATAVWAAPLLTCVTMAYFTATLIHLLRVTPKERILLRSFPWIALFNHPLSRALTVASICAAPWLG